MSDTPSVWSRIKRWFRPERETYETRRARGADPTAAEPHIAESTDGRRSGGSMQIGP